MENEIRFTTAPEAYDYSYVENFGTLYEYVQSNGKTIPVRKVGIPEASLNYQEGRYNSGLHPSWTSEDLLEHFKYGLIKGYEGG